MAQAVSHSLVAALRAVPAFASFDERALVQVVGASTNLFWPAGSTVFEKGSESEALYIVLSGQVAIFDVSDGEDVEIARIGPGDFFGELSLLLETTHSKTAVALEASELMVLPKESFQELLVSRPDLAAHFRRTAEERLPLPQVSKLA